MCRYQLIENYIQTQEAHDHAMGSCKVLIDVVHVESDRDIHVFIDDFIIVMDLIENLEGSIPCWLQLDVGSSEESILSQVHHGLPRNLSYPKCTMAFQGIYPIPSAS